jgi:hypothetical protein
MIARPQRLVLHQQLGSQLQTQLNGLWTFWRRLRPIGADLSPRLSGERNGSRAQERLSEPTEHREAALSPTPRSLRSCTPRWLVLPRYAHDVREPSFKSKPPAREGVSVGAPGFEPGTDSPPGFSSGRAPKGSKRREVACRLPLRPLGPSKAAWLRKAVSARLCPERVPPGSGSVSRATISMWHGSTRSQSRCSWLGVEAAWTARDRDRRQVRLSTSWLTVTRFARSTTMRCRM